MTSAHSISAVVPIYNERSYLPQAVEELDGFLGGHFVDYEIIIVESGSTDGTAEACDDTARALPRVRVHHEGRRNGFGSAVRLGFSLATKEWVWPVVVDTPYGLDALLSAIPLLDQHDCILSYRTTDPRSLYRRIQSSLFNRLGRAVLGVRVRHINSAFKLVRTSLVRSMTLTSTGWLLDAELVMRLEQRGVRYAEIPVELRLRPQGRSSVGPRAVVRTVLDLAVLASRR